MAKSVLTFDTNCVIDLQKGKDEHIKELWKMKEEGQIEIVKTDVVGTEMGMNSKKISEDIGNAVVDHSRIGHAKIAGNPKSSEINEDVGTAYYDNTRYGHGTYGGSTNDIPLDGIILTLFPSTKGMAATKQQVRDAMSLQTHIKYNRDCFVSKDRDFLDNKELLKTKYNVTVFSPSECLDFLKNI